MAQGDYLGIVMQSDIGAQGENGVASQSDLQSAAQTATTAKNDIDAIMTPKTIGPTALAGFSDGVDGAILNKCVVNIEPVQSGSGDPSPTNVRPISGWTGAKVSVTGKNLYTNSPNMDNSPAISDWNKLSEVHDGNPVYYRNGMYSGLYYNTFLPIGTYTASIFVKTNDGASVGFFVTPAEGASKNPAEVSPSTYIIVPTTENDWVRVSYTFSVAKSGEVWPRLERVSNGEIYISSPQIDIGTVISTYEPYVGNTYTISFGEAGTVYGGTLDVGTGVLKVRPYYASYSGQSLIGPWISSHDVYTPGGTPTTGAQVVDMGGAEITYQLTPVQVRTILGLNNIYADCGDVTVQYRGDVPNLYENVAVITEQKNKFYCPPLYQYDGEDLTVKFASEIAQYSDLGAWLKARLAAKDISGIFVKDYFKFTTSNNVTFTARVADINHDLGYGDTEVTKYHIDFICDELWPDNHVWNKVNYNNGLATEPSPWLASDLYHFLNSLSGNVPNDTSADPVTVAVDYTGTGVLDKFPAWLQNAIVERHSLEPTRYTSGSLLTDDNSSAWKNIGKLWVPSEIEYYGFVALGTRNRYSIGEDHMYPLLRDGKTRIKSKPNGDRYNIWLRRALSGNSTDAAFCNSYGDVSGYNCSISWSSFPICFRIMAN